MLAHHSLYLSNSLSLPYSTTTTLHGTQHHTKQQTTANSFKTPPQPQWTPLSLLVLAKLVLSTHYYLLLLLLHYYYYYSPLLLLHQTPHSLTHFFRLIVTCPIALVLVLLAVVVQRWDILHSKARHKQQEQALPRPFRGV